MANEFIIKNGYFSQGNSNVTGSLQVTGSVGVTGSVSVTQNLTASKALFSSSNGNQLTVIGSGSTIAQVYGSQGNLLTVNDTFSGSIFTVTDISGYPILDITSDYYTSSINTIGFLNHTGSAGVTGSLIVSGGFEVYDIINDLKNINSDLRSLYDAGGANSIQWDQRILTDGVATVVNWQDRKIYYATGVDAAIDWSTTDQILISGSVIPAGPYVSNTSSYDLGSPTAAWNKIYVSNNSLHFVSGSVSASIGFNNGVISFNDATVSIPTGSVVPTASYALTASYIENGGTSGVSSLTVGTGLSGSSTTGNITLNLSATAYTTYANNTAATATPSLVTFKEVGEQAMVATITWNNTPPSGVTNLRYRWFQIGNMVQYFFFFNYGTGGLNNSTITFDFPADMPTPTPPTGTGTTSTYIYRGHGLGQTSPTNPSTAVGSGFWGGGIRRDSGNTKYEFFFSVGTAIAARAFYHSGFYFV